MCRERERERAQSSDRAPVRRPQQRTPQTKLQIDDQSCRSQHRADQAKIDSNTTRSRLCRAISPLDRTQSPLSLPSSLNLIGFDEFFFLGFVSFVFLYWPDLMNFFSEFCFFCISVLTGFDEFFSWVLFLLCFCIEEWYYIFVWQLRKCEKMWAISRKCVFYGIFKNTIKYQKIFFKTFFEMQPNTWKYSPFPKITFSKNIYLKKNILHEPNTTFITTFVLLLRRERLDQAIVTCLSSLYILLGFRCFMSTLINTSK